MCGEDTKDEKRNFCYGHSGGGVMIAVWDSINKPGETERSLMKAAASVASLMAPRFVREEALTKAHEEIQVLKGEIAQESHLAGVGRCVPFLRFDYG